MYQDHISVHTNVPFGASGSHRGFMIVDFPKYFRASKPSCAPMSQANGDRHRASKIMVMLARKRLARIFATSSKRTAIVCQLSAKRRVSSRARATRVDSDSDFEGTGGERMNINGEHAVRIAQLLWGSTPSRLGSLIAIAGIGVLTSIVQHVIEGVFRAATGTELGIPETSQWVGWGLLVIGVLLSVYGGQQQLALQKPVTPNPHDVENLRKLRSMLHSDLLFFREHNFNFSFDRSKTDGLDQFTYEWRGAHHDFVDPNMQEKLINLRASANELAEAIAINTYPVDTNPSWSTPHPGSNALNADERALEAGKLLNDWSTGDRAPPQTCPVLLNR